MYQHYKYSVCIETYFIMFERFVKSNSFSPSLSEHHQSLTLYYMNCENPLFRAHLSPELSWAPNLAINSCSSLPIPCYVTLRKAGRQGQLQCQGQCECAGVVMDDVAVPRASEYFGWWDGDSVLPNVEEKFCCAI